MYTMVLRIKIESDELISIPEVRITCIFRAEDHPAYCASGPGVKKAHKKQDKHNKKGKKKKTRRSW